MQNRVIKCPKCNCQYIITGVYKDYLHIKDSVLINYCPICGNEFDIREKLNALESNVMDDFD